MGIRHNDRNDFYNEGEEYEGEEYEAHERCGDVDREEVEDDLVTEGDPRPLVGGFSFSSTDWSGWED